VDVYDAETNSLVKAAAIKSDSSSSHSLPSKLYHGTSMSGIVGILKDNAMDEGIHWGRTGEPHGIRLTQSKQIAMDFAVEGLGGEEGAVIEFDTQALSRKYQLSPHEDVDCRGDKWQKSEEEVVVVTSRLTSVSKYISAIYVKNFTSHSDVQDYAQLVEQEERMPAKEWLKGYAKLLKNPIVKTAKEEELESSDHTNDDGYWAGDNGQASGILPIAKDTGRICLAWRNEECHQGDCWGGIGGAVQKGKSPEESAKAEMAEETGYDGAIETHPAYVFTDGGFTYTNFVGAVSHEFKLNPQNQHSWETDSIEWFTLDEIQADMKKNKGDYHPGLVSLFKESAALIEKLAGSGKKQATFKVADIPRGFKAPKKPVSKEYEAVRTVYDWFQQTSTDKLSWRDFSKQFQQYSQKFAGLFTKIRGNRPVLTVADLEAYLAQYAGEDRYTLGEERYDDAEVSFREVEQLVLKINQGADAKRIIGGDSILQGYLDMLGQSSRQSGHPADADTVGWVRMDFVDKDWLVIDEVQSDMVNSIVQAKNIITAEDFEDFLSRLPSDEGREQVRKKVPAAYFPQIQGHFLSQGYTVQVLDETRAKLIDLFEDWTEYAVATVLKIARDFHCGPTLSTRTSS